MKILVLSLLRVGDLIQQRPLLQKLREQNPGAEIHLLVNSSVLSVRSLFPEVDLWFAFDRHHFQKQVGTAEVSLLAPVRELGALIQELHNEHYDRILNLTHTRLSAYFAELIPAPMKQGLVAEGRGFRRFENLWLTHFNERFSARGRSPFHYVEILAECFDLGPLRAPQSKAKGPKILLQPLTSDAKKNYHLSAWRQLQIALKRQYPRRDVLVLGAPFEKEELLRHFEIDELFICDWQELQKTFQQAALLISGDTSVKHLAAQAGVPVLEIALGSADPSKTGVFANGSYILHSQISCAPCAHHGPCRRMSHLCGESLPVETVFETACAILEEREPQTPDAPMMLVKTHFQNMIGRSQSVEMDFEKAVWRMTLDQRVIPESGTWARVLESRVDQELLRKLEGEQAALEEIFQLKMQLWRDLSEACFAGGLAAALVQSFRQQILRVLPMPGTLRDYFWELEDALAQSFSSPMQLFGYLKIRFERIGRRIEMRQKLIQQLREDLRGTVSGKQIDRGLEAP